MDELLRQRLNRKLGVANLSTDVSAPKSSDEGSLATDNTVNDYIPLQEDIILPEPRFSTLEAIITDPSKFALVLLFGVSLYALYVLNKSNK